MQVEKQRLRYEPLRQAAQRCGLSVGELRRSIASGDLNAYRCGPRIIRVDPLEVDSIGSNCRVPAEQGEVPCAAGSITDGRREIKHVGQEANGGVVAT